MTDLVFQAPKKKQRVTYGPLERSVSLGGVNRNYYLANLRGNGSPRASSVPVALSFWLYCRNYFNIFFQRNSGHRDTLTFGVLPWRCSDALQGVLGFSAAIPPTKSPIYKGHKSTVKARSKIKQIIERKLSEILNQEEMLEILQVILTREFYHSH